MASKSASMTQGQGFKAMIWPLYTLAVGAILCAIFWACGVVGLTAMTYWHSDAPEAALRDLASEEVLHAAELDAQMNASMLHPMSVAIHFGDATKDIVTRVLMHGMRSLLNLPKKFPGHKGADNLETEDTDPGKTYFDHWWADKGQVVQAALWANYVFAARSLAFLIGAIPLLLLTYVVAWIDGACARAVRRAEVARESSSLYHRFKISQIWVLGGVSLCYLVWPKPVNPVLVIVPTVLVCAWLARMQVAFYKKYA